MKIMRLSDSALVPVLIEENVPQPQPERGELLVRVYAAGVTSKELLCYSTTYSKNGERRSRAIPGHEFSGVMAAVGEDVAGFDIGQEVYGMNDWFSDGAMAEFCITQPTSVAPKPPRMTEKHYDARQLEQMVNHQAGLLGVSGARPDRKALLKQQNRNPAAQAVDMFCYQLRKHIGVLTAGLGGLDALVFTKGLENAPPQCGGRCAPG